MTAARVYLPVDAAGLRRLRDHGRLEAPLAGHALTPALAETLRAEGVPPATLEEEGEYAALTAAALASALGRDPDQPARRVVLAVDVAGWRAAADPGPGGHPGAVVVDTDVVRRRVAAVHLDSAAAEPAVRAVAAARDDPAAGATILEAALEACLEHELGWYALQELDTVLDVLDGSPTGPG